MARLRYPTGVRPLLIDATARRRHAENRTVSILERAGFAEIVLPVIDYADPYDGGGELDRLSSYRFVDRDGEVVVIRSDFTPMVARALAPVIHADELPLRVFYRGDVIRCEPSRLGARREIFQIGAEIIGDDSPAADAEVLTIVTSILEELGHRPFIVYSDQSIPERIGPNVREVLAAKNSTASSIGIIAKLADGTATLDDLRAYPGTAEVAERLAAIPSRPELVLHLDDVDQTRGYYTGLRFRAYESGSRVAIARGGRYDALYGHFGTPAPAVGFTFTIDALD